MGILDITFSGLIFGMLGTTLGGIIGSFLNVKNNKYLSFLLEFTAGLMLAIICFELIPEALSLAEVGVAILGILLGVACMIICDNKIEKKYKTDNSTSLLKTGLIIGLGLAIHNLPEGLAIGSGFNSSEKLGYALAIAIAIHDIPEGVSIALPLKKGGLSRTKAIIFTMISGLTTGIGALIGGIVGRISEISISIALAFAAGAMLYIVSGELIPESKKMYKGRFAVIGNILGFVLGMLAMSI